MQLYLDEPQTISMAIHRYNNHDSQSQRSHASTEPKYNILIEEDLDL